MRIFAWYRSFFYTIYTFSQDFFGELDIPHINALFFASVFLGFNFETFLVIVDYMLGRTFLTRIGFGKVFALAIMTGIVTANYFLFLKDAKYKQLAKEFESETSRQKKIRVVLVLSYLLVSFFGLFGLLFWLAPKN